VAFTVVKYAGAVYLVYLGIQALRAGKAEAEPDMPQPVSLRRIFRDGFVVALLNPKTAIFFAAFLPQFMSHDSAPALQGIALGVLFVAIAAVTDSIYALAASAVAPILAQACGVRAWGRYATGGAFIGLGLFTAFAGSRGGQ
jgi:threonine/homoserine/homoserine lactone efflux protein